MARGGLVWGLPCIEQEEQLCKAYLAGKQRRTPFPQQSMYLASNRLKLVVRFGCTGHTGWEVLLPPLGR